MKNNKKHIFDEPKNVKRVLTFLYVTCGLLFILDFVIHRHVIHSWEKLWGFYPIYGFVGCVILVMVATWMRTFLMRSEDYYEEGDCKNSHKNIDEDPNKTDINLKTDAYDKHSSKIGDHNVDD